MRWPAETAGTVFPFFAAFLPACRGVQGAGRDVERGFGFHCRARACLCVTARRQVEPGPFGLLAAFDFAYRKLGLS